MCIYILVTARYPVLGIYSYINIHYTVVTIQYFFFTSSLELAGKQAISLCENVDNNNSCTYPHVKPQC